MNRKIVSALAAASVASSLLAGVSPVTALADGTMVVSIGADLTEDQKTAILKYFGIYGNNSVQTITVTNQDERNHLASYIPIEQIGTRTISCALVKPTTSGGVQVKTANLDYITSNMIASNLVTCGVTNCQAIAAAPFEVSGTGALTGILMAYENATGTQISQQAKDLSAQEIQITEDISATAQNQQVAQQIVNDVKLQVIDGVADNSTNTDNSVVVDNSVDNSAVSNVVNNVVNNYTTNNNGITLSEEDIQKLTDYAVQLANQAYQQGSDAARQQVEAQAQIQQNLSEQTGIESTDTTTQIIDQAAQEQTSQESGQESAADSASSDSSDSADTSADASGDSSSEDIFANTDITALNDGDTSGTLVTGTDSSVTSNDTAAGAVDNDAAISADESSSDSSAQTPDTTAQTDTDASGLVITTQDSSTVNADGTDNGSTDAAAAETGSSDASGSGDAAVTDASDTGTTADAAEAGETSSSDGTAADQAQETPQGDTAGTPAAEQTVPAADITADNTDSYSTSYLNDGTVAHIPAFVLAIRKSNLVPVSGTLTVSDGSGNVLGTADLSDRSQVTSVASGSANNDFMSLNGWDQMTGLFFQPKDSSGSILTADSSTSYVLTLNGTFAQTQDPNQTDGAPAVTVDLENISYYAVPADSEGFDFGQTSLSDIKAGSTLTATVIDDGSFTDAVVSSLDGSAAVNTSDGTGTVYSGGDTTVYITLQNAAGLVEVDINYESDSGETEADADGNMTSVMSSVNSVRYLIPVQPAQ